MAQNPSLIGHEIANSSTIEQQIQTLVKEVTRLEEPLKEVRAPLPAFVDAGKKEFDRAGAVRGRPLHYSYMGTGAGRGVFVELEDGSVKIDMINGIGIHLLGHAHPRVMAAGVRGALADIVNQGNLQPNKEYTRMLEKLVQLAGRKSRLKYGWLSTCGTMANESALKITRQKKTPARMMMSFQNAFAGRSTMMAELTDNPAYRVGLPEYNEVLRLPFYDKRDARSGEKTLTAMKEFVAKHENNISVFAFEPMLGEGGYRPAPREFFVPLLEFCREKKIPVWADEVQTFTRTGEFFAFETLGIGEYIDLCTIAKTAQVGATLYTEEMNPAPGLIAGTFSGSTAALASGLEILNIMEEGYMGPNGRVMQIHNKFVGMLNRLNETTCKGKLVDAEGMGLMIAVTPLDGKKETVDKLLKKMFTLGLIAFPCGKDPVRIRFLVPAVTQDHEIEMVGKIIEQTILEGV
ncbi:MAG: aminotransferase class III-fold pyridoxal phosphate-dependent enzyme [Bdellovibrionaceae bacterium]|nr:aminotransferase class III-fold pyridoxal phosphate-dependent enzyme [Pseudobdellovibrionaceae bacterium]